LNTSIDYQQIQDVFGKLVYALMTYHEIRVDLVVDKSLDHHRILVNLLSNVSSFDHEKMPDFDLIQQINDSKNNKLDLSSMNIQTNWKNVHFPCYC